MPYSNRSRWRGATLVEVVVGMSLLATLLVTLLGQFHNHRVRLHAAGQRIEAADVADQILTAWLSDLAPAPVNQSGIWNHQWYWTTRLVRQQLLFQQPINVVRLEVRKSPNSLRRPLVSVEFIDRMSQEIVP